MTIRLVAVALFAVGVPLLPTNDLKVFGTLIAALVLAASFLRRAERWKGRTALDLPILAFLLVAGVATWKSVTPILSLLPTAMRGEGYVVYLIYGLMALAAARLARQERRDLLDVLVICAGAVGALSLLQFYGVDPTTYIGNQNLHYLSRAWGTLANPVFLGGYCVLVLPIVLQDALRFHDRGRCVTASVVAVLLLSALVASATRTAWAGAVVAFAVFVLRSRPDRRWIAAAVLACAVVVGGQVATRPAAALAIRAETMANPADSSLRQREFMWHYVVPTIKKRPWFGWGYSTLIGRLPGYFTRDYYRAFGPHLTVIDEVHNDLLQTAHDIGLVGLAAYLSVWAVALWSSWRTSPALFAGLVGYGLWLQLAWQHIGPANLWWMVVGLSVLRGQDAVRPHAG